METFGFVAAEGINQMQSSLNSESTPDFFALGFLVGIVLVIVAFSLGRRYAASPGMRTEEILELQNRGKQFGKNLLIAVLVVTAVHYIVFASVLSSFVLLAIGLLVFSVFTVSRHVPKGEASQQETVSHRSDGVFRQGFQRSFQQSSVRIYRPEEISTRFSDVAGMASAIEQVQIVLAFLKDAERFRAFGAEIPRGILFAGPPGCGKTLLARAIAGEAKVSFLEIVGTEFVEMYVGVGASRVRDLFAKARECAPAIVFIDEIDAMGRTRTGTIAGKDEQENALQQLLAEMDGFRTKNDKDVIVVIAATNRPEILDPALKRPGRFGMEILIDKPDLEGRRAILEVHTRGKPFGRDVDLLAIAKKTVGASGADLAEIVNRAAIGAALRKGASHIEMRDMMEAFEWFVLGRGEKRIYSERVRRTVAYHEAGHTVVAWCLAPDAALPESVSIVPRGKAGGYTWMEPPEDEGVLQPKRALFARLAVLMGGYAAEILFLGQENVTPGSMDDRERATDLAGAIVKQYGMSSLGPRTFGKVVASSFLGSQEEYRNYSEEVARRIDEEISSLIAAAQERAHNILEANRKKVEDLVAMLIERETVEKKELEVLFGGPGAESAFKAASAIPVQELQSREKEKQGFGARFLGAVKRLYSMRFSARTSAKNSGMRLAKR